MELFSKQCLKHLSCGILWCLGFVQTYVFIRLYWLVSCVIPTYSMSPTLLAGDYIIISLRIPGRRLVREDNARLGHYIISRKKGDRSVRVGDVVVFNFPYSKGEEQMRMNFDLYFCKRCVAIPGETYIWEWDAVSDSVYLPRQEEVVVIDSLNFRHYNRCIEYETGIMPKLLNGTVMHADTLMHSYRFKNNYYFTRGDNCVDSYDSRFWGILPEDFILGTGQFIWFSKDRDMGKIRWERMFRKL